PGSGGGVPHDETDRPGEDELVQPCPELLTAPDEERDALERELLKGGAVERAKLEAQRSSHRAVAGHVEVAQISHVARVRNALELERPEVDVVRRSVLAGRLLTAAQVRAERGAARHPNAVRERPLAPVRTQLHDGHRRRRGEVVRIQHREQALGEARELAVDLELHACGQEREALEEPLHVRIRALEPIEPEPARDLRILARELAAELAQVLELAPVVREQAFVHQSLSPPASEIITSPVSRSMSVRKKRRSGSGCAQSSASIPNTSALGPNFSASLRSRTRTEFLMSRGSKSRITRRRTFSSVGTWMLEAVRPVRSGRPTLTVEPSSRAFPSSSCAEAREVELNSHVRSRRTLSRRR